MAKVRTRFAPSPTGFMHVGSVRTALFAWLVARQAGGDFILRLEDTDKAREVKGSEDHIIESLQWLGLAPDESPETEGQAGPYRQSERLDTYKEWGQKLIDNGRAYADPYSPTELEAMRAKAKAAKKPFLFRDFRPTDPPTWDGSQPLRFKSEPKAYNWQDEVMGDLAAGPEAIDDFILIKSDGFPTYNFAHIIDDHLMAVSHVIRSQEFLPSVPRYLNLYEALAIESPKLGTLPYVLGPDGTKKLSKRDGAKDILEYRREGYLPEALVNFLASLGWNDGTEQEIFQRDELISKFDLSKVQRSGARFDEQRLTWMNGHYIRELPEDEITERADNFWSDEAKKADALYRQRVLALVQERLKFFAELPELTNFFFVEPKAADVSKLLREPADKQLKKLEVDEIHKLLKAVEAELEVSDFSAEDLTKRLNHLLAQLNTKPGILFAAVRVAVTGSKVSPEIFGTLATLGKQTSLKRIKKAISTLEKSL